jgi:hypothetical protein
VTESLDIAGRDLGFREAMLGSPQEEGLTRSFKRAQRAIQSEYGVALDKERTEEVLEGMWITLVREGGNLARITVQYASWPLQSNLRRENRIHGRRNQHDAKR